MGSLGRGMGANSHHPEKETAGYEITLIFTAAWETLPFAGSEAGRRAGGGGGQRRHRRRISTYSLCCEWLAEEQGGELELVLLEPFICRWTLLFYLLAGVNKTRASLWPLTSKYALLNLKYWLVLLLGHTSMLSDTLCHAMAVTRSGREEPCYSKCSFIPL